MTHQERHKRRQKIAELVGRGQSRDKVAKKMGVSLTLVERVCQLHGISPHKKFGPVASDKTDVLKVLFDILNGESPANVARKFGITRQRIHQFVVRARAAGFNIPPGRPKGQPKRQNVKKSKSRNVKKSKRRITV